MDPFNEKMDKVSRVEVITQEGRQVIAWPCKNARLSFQDGGRTLKVFIDEAK